MNRDPVTAEMQRRRNQIEQLQAALLYVKGDSSTPFEELQVTEKSFEIAKSLGPKAKFIAHKKWIVVGATDGLLRAYNYNTMESVVELKAHTDYINSVVVHPSLPYVLSASSDTLIKLWNWENDWECVRTFKGHTYYIMHVAFKPRDTSVFVSASLDRSIKTWNIGYSSPLSSIEGHEMMSCVEFLNTDEKLYLVLAYYCSHNATVWDYEIGTCVQTVKGHTDCVTSVLSVHSDVNYIITGSEDGTIPFWNAKTYNSDHVFTSELGRVWTIGFKKDSSRLILGCEEGIVIGQVISATLKNPPQPPHTTLENPTAFHQQPHHRKTAITHRSSHSF